MLHHLIKNSCRSKSVVRRIHEKCKKLIKVQVKQGIVVGEERNLPNGNSYYSFQGIPYAIPPTGELRFKSPLPLERFDQPELFCLKERDVCHQRDSFTGEAIGSENCLFLNVYAPKVRSHVAKSLPVMVFVHGGGFWFGSGNSDYYLPLYLMQEDVIVVTLNYRLGAWGFLVLPEEGVWGNSGLKDQRLALKWVADNISSFNGNPGNVTLFGESAGAAAVHLHLCSQYDNKFFHKAIMQSGSANMEWVFQENPSYRTRRLAELCGFQQSCNDAKNMLKFLQSPSVTPEKILAKTVDTLTVEERRKALPFAFKPVIEDNQSPDCFISTPIMEKLKEYNFLLNVPIIMGYNSAEGCPMLVNVRKKTDLYENDFERLVPRNLPLETEEDIQAIARKMRDFYLKGERICNENLDQVKNLLSDNHFIFELQNAAELMVRYQPEARVYFYRFDYVGGRNFYKTLLQMDKLKGACHGDELFYLFQMAAEELKYNANDLKVTQQLCKLWANFAYAGQPTHVDFENPLVCDWRHVKAPENVETSTFSLDYLNIDGSDGQMKCNPDQERMEFWREIYKIYKPKDYSKLSMNK
ncbi:cricklet [Glossina fuscipes fuscipes]